MENTECIITFQPHGVRIEADMGEFLSDAASRAGVKIDRHCGGVGVCGKCRVSVLKGGKFLKPLTDTERKVLSDADIANGIRLACCAAVIGSGEVYVLDGVEMSGNQILDSISGKLITNWAPDCEGYGVAVDIGTTTVVCYLLDLDGHKEVDRFSFLNPQVSFGDDVISRIAFSNTVPDGLQRLQKILTDEMDSALSVLAERNGIKKDQIREVTAAGNTVMEHLFLGVSPESIGHSPYMPGFLTHSPVPAKELGLNIHQAAVVKLLPNVAGYVGGDIVAGVAALDMDKDPRIRLMVDIGTNNEIVIGNSEALFCCATAAGPAFEGARIQYGMRASTGAIEKVTLTESGLICQTIDNTAPKGLCGSGLVDAVALLLETEMMNKNGRLQSPEKCRDERFRERMDRDRKGIIRLLLTDARDPVYLTQKDIREVQLAVGAVKVGIEVMVERMGITLDDIYEVLLAGAFGNNIDIGSAITVGLLPRVSHGKIRSVYNSSGLGASLSLASSEFYEGTKTTAEKMSYVELSSLADFQKRFIRAMIFS